MADQSSRGGGCLAGVGRAQAQQSFHPWVAPFLLYFSLFLSHSTLGLGEESDSGGGQHRVKEETWVPDCDLGQLPTAVLCLLAGEKRSRTWTRPFLAFGEWKIDTPLPGSWLLCNTRGGHNDRSCGARLVREIPGSSCSLLFLWLSYWKI